VIKPLAAALAALAAVAVHAQYVAPASGKPGKLHLLPATLETTQWG
jgi:hypothetical protein